MPCPSDPCDDTLVIPDVLADRLRYAVLDTGATETVGSMDALEHVLMKRFELFGHEDVVIDVNNTKEFKFGNGQTRAASSFVCLPQTIGNRSTTLGIYALDVPIVPILLGIRTLQKLGAVLDLDKGTLEFRRIFPGKIVQLIKGANGHLLLDLCSDWCSPGVFHDNIFTTSVSHEPADDGAPPIGSPDVTEAEPGKTEVRSASMERADSPLRLHDSHTEEPADDTQPVAAKVQATSSLPTKVLSVS